MWKDFFYYSKSERRAILLLLAVAVLALGAYVGTGGWRYRQEYRLAEGGADADSFRIRVKERGNVQLSARKPQRRDTRQPVQEAVLAEFNPNTADSLTLRRLGLPVFVVRNVLRYREKGGVFRTPEAFSKIYGLSSEQYLALRPYIVVPSREVVPVVSGTAHADSSRDMETVLSEYPQGMVIDLNAADTVELKRVPGIGSVLARRIVSYRQRLGGFCRVEQLQEIEHVDIAVNRWFRTDGKGLRRLELNRAGLDRLRSHPYMDFYKAKAVLEYRRKRGKIESLSRLSLFEEFSEKDLERLSPYLSFE